MLSYRSVILLLVSLTVVRAAAATAASASIATNTDNNTTTRTRAIRPTPIIYANTRRGAAEAELLDGRGTDVKGDERKLSEDQGNNTEEGKDDGSFEGDIQKEFEKEENDIEQTDGNSNEHTNLSHEVTGNCASTNSDYEMMITLTPKLDLHWTLDAEANKMSILLEFDGEAWLALGFSQTGTMIGSEAIIGLPAERTALKYDLSGKKDSSSVVKSASQTLLNATIIQEGGYTQLKFNKLLNENNGELVVAPKGFNTLIFAVGASNALGYHQHRGSFRLDLDTCSTVVRRSSHMGAWATHGTFAVLAWAISSPFAMAVAWFRTLMPSSWIYMHVLCNVMSYLFALIAVIIAFASMSSQSKPTHFSEPHHWVGLILIVAMTFQTINGFLRPPVEKRDPYAPHDDDDDGIILKMPQTPREIWFASHRVTGGTMLAMGIYQIQSGLNLFARNFNVASLVPWYWAYVGMFASGLFGLSFWIRYEEYEARKGMETISNSSNVNAEKPDALPVNYETR